MPAAGPKYPSTFANDTSNGGSTTYNWAFTANLSAADGSYCSPQNVPAGTGTTPYCVCTNFAFTTADVPSSASVTQVVIEIGRRGRQVGPPGTVQDQRVRLVIGGTVQASPDLADTATSWPTTEATQAYAFTTGLPTAAQVVATGFGVAFAATLNDFAADVDFVRATVSYTGGPAPTADFSADSTAPTTSQAVNFTDLSANSPTSWGWEARLSGGTYGQFSTAQNPSYTFGVAGTYDVKLTATNSAGSDTKERLSYVTASPPPPPPPPVTGTYVRAGSALDLGQPVRGNAPANRSLFAWWLGLPNWAGGNDLPELVGRNHASLSVRTWAGAPGGTAGVTFDGSSSYAAATGVTAGGLTQFSIAFWGRQNSAVALRAVLSEFSTAANAGWIVETGTSGAGASDRMLVATSGSNYGYTAPGLCPAGEWHRWLWVFDGTQSTNATRCALYRDGAAVSLTFAGTIDSSITAAAGGVQFARTSDGARFGAWTLADVRAHSRALSAQEALRDFHQSRLLWPAELRRLPRRVLKLATGGTTYAISASGGGSLAGSSTPALGCGAVGGAAPAGASSATATYPTATTGTATAAGGTAAAATYSPAAAGSAAPGGLGPAAVSYSLLAFGTAAAGGAGGAATVYSPAATGGAAASGAAATVDWPVTSGGFALAGGDAGAASYAPVVSGAATGGGAADAPAIYAPEAVGTAAPGGSFLALVEVGATGAAFLSGAADLGSRTFAEAMAGGLALDGTVPPVLALTVTGGAGAAGISTLAATLLFVPVAGLVLAGPGVNATAYAPAAVGGAMAMGTAAPAWIVPVAGGGLISLGGSASVDGQLFSVATAGGTVLAGAASWSANCAPVALGGATGVGFSNATAAYQTAGSGGPVATGLVVSAGTYPVASFGGPDLSGAVPIALMLLPVGGAAAGGAGVIATDFAPTAAGLAALSGTVFPAAGVVAAGGAAGAGAAILAAVFPVASLGTASAGGTGIPSLVSPLATTGGPAIAAAAALSLGVTGSGGGEAGGDAAFGLFFEAVASGGLAFGGTLVPGAQFAAATGGFAIGGFNQAGFLFSEVMTGGTGVAGRWKAIRLTRSTVTARPNDGGPVIATRSAGQVLIARKFAGQTLTGGR